MILTYRTDFYPPEHNQHNNLFILQKLVYHSLTENVTFTLPEPMALVKPAVLSM